ncbi:hypothetical protein NL676_037091 [Syzygium grande]|nr:hypothetical protein NL676_037091 [Syzygium grande]
MCSALRLARATPTPRRLRQARSAVAHEQRPSPPTSKLPPTSEVRLLTSTPPPTSDALASDAASALASDADASDRLGFFRGGIGTQYFLGVDAHLADANIASDERGPSLPMSNVHHLPRASRGVYCHKKTGGKPESPGKANPQVKHSVDLSKPPTKKWFCCIQSPAES